MTYCRTCEKDVHITHDADECTGEPDKRVPDELREREQLAHREKRDEPARDQPDLY
jgi:hypothetical protein